MATITLELESGKVFQFEVEEIEFKHFYIKFRDKKTKSILHFNYDNIKTIILEK